MDKALNNRREEPLLFVVQKTSKGRECVVKSSKTMKTIQNLAIIKAEAQAETDPQSQPTLPINDGEEIGNWDYCSSLDGLIMLKSCDSDHHLMLWNPSIRKARRIPPCPQISNQMTALHFGLGFDPLTRDYKHVVLVRNTSEPSLQFVAIYTVDSNSWMTIEFKGQYPDGLHHAVRSTVCFEGVLYDPVGVSFDLRTETFALLSLPHDLNPLFCFSSLTAMHNCLGLVQITHNIGYIHVLQQGNWILRYKFPLTAPECCGRSSIFSIQWPVFLYLTHNGEVLLNWETAVTSVNIKTGEQKILLEEEFDRGSVVCHYIESLLLLK